MSTMKPQKKYVYMFQEGSKEMIDLLGGKGAHLSEMVHIGLPVPPGFTISTEACNTYLETGQFPQGLWEEILQALGNLENLSGKKFGNPANPLLVSCRSGAKISMPGMMDTVLNIGMNEEIVAEMIISTQNPRFVFDAYRRFIQMFGSIVMGVSGESFEQILSDWRKRCNVDSDSGLEAKDLRHVVNDFNGCIRAKIGDSVPSDPYEQLRLAVEVVFRSWNGKRAIDYRNAARISHDLGTAVSIVAMVFGNMGNDSATGIVMTRNGQNGKRELEGDYLINAQGEDVVAGTKLTKPIHQLEQDMPNIYRELVDIAQGLELHYRDMQDIEFTIEQGKLWILQTRSGKRAAKAAVRIATDMVEEGLITKSEGVQRVEPSMLEHLLHDTFESNAKKIAKSEGRMIGIGLAASPGAAVGQIVLDANRAEQWVKDKGRKVILVRPETKPDDVHGMLVSEGILTGQGGKTSHAAVVARHFGKPAVVGCAELTIDLEKRAIQLGDQVLKEGDLLSIDGGTGEIFMGVVPKVVPDFQDPYFDKFLSFADELSRMEVWANADRPGDAELARKFGAKGIGLCRTEHMFLDEDRIPLFRAMILAGSKEERERELAKLFPLQRVDFEGLFRAMDGFPVVIRLLDPPLHEFLPNYEALLLETVELRHKCDEILLKTDEGILKARQTLKENETMLNAIRNLRESNPMLGLRGLRLGILMPEISIMQVRAIMEAASNVLSEGRVVCPKIMIPLTAHINELTNQYEILRTVAEQVLKERGQNISYRLGTMIELPRACLIAGNLAEISDFFSFGTNDLTQMTYGISRDDAEKRFLMHYLEHGILSENPFKTIDEEGVGELIAIGVERGRKTRPDIEIGICGEHGGDPKSIAFCHKVGMDYVSCSPFRLPIARLAAAHAALRNKKV